MDENKNEQVQEGVLLESVTKEQNILVKRLANLISVKSLTTLCLTIVFSYMAVTGQISQDFMTIYAVIIAFYFGTQSQKIQDTLDGKES